MLKLHGVALSNYYSLAKACLLEKGVEFEEVKAPPSQDEGYLEKSPMGKVPCLETEQGFFSEAFAIADYLDRVYPESPLLPKEAFACAKTIELIRHMELDVELVARRCLPEAMFGRPVSDETKASTEKDLAKGLRAVARLVVCDPYIAGPEFTLADIYAVYVFGLSGTIAEKMFGKDLLADLPQVKQLLATLGERPSMKRVEADKAR
jgi:glutathione S-transferase